MEKSFSVQFTFMGCCDYIPVDSINNIQCLSSRGFVFISIDEFASRDCSVLYFPLCPQSIAIFTSYVQFHLQASGIFLIGVYLVLVLFYWDVTYVEFASIRALLSLTLLVGIALMALFVLIGPISIKFVNDHQSYTVHLIQNQLTTVILCLCRLLLSICIGLISGFVAASLVTISFKPLKEFVHVKLGSIYTPLW